MDVTRRYFDIEQEIQLGGGVAYTLLFGNGNLYRDQHTDVGSKIIEDILAADSELLARHPSSNLFTFAVCRPKAILSPQPILDCWRAEENEREAYAVRNGGRYYPPTILELIYNEMFDVKDQNRILRTNPAGQHFRTGRERCTLALGRLRLGMPAPEVGGLGSPEKGS
jgi:hypothetical protein